MKLSLSLRTKLVALSASLITAITIFVSAFFPARLERIARTGAERRAVGMATVLAAAVAPGLEFDDPVNVRDLLEQLAVAEGVSYAGVRRDGGADFASWHPERVPPGAAIRAVDQPVVDFRADVLHVAVPVRAKAGARGSVILGLSLAELLHDKQSDRAAVAVVAVVMLVLGFAVSFALGTFIVGPIRRMTAIADRIADGQLAQPDLAIGGRDEVGRMAEAFDRMLRALRALAAAADEVAAGNLTGRIEIGGQVAEAFNRMIEAQRLVVRQIAVTADRLAAALRSAGYTDLRWYAIGARYAHGFVVTTRLERVRDDGAPGEEGSRLSPRFPEAGNLLWLEGARQPRLPGEGRYRVLLVAFTDLPIGATSLAQRRSEQTWMVERPEAPSAEVDPGRRVSSGYRVGVYEYDYRSGPFDGEGSFVPGDEAPRASPQSPVLSALLGSPLYVAPGGSRTPALP